MQLNYLIDSDSAAIQVADGVYRGSIVLSDDVIADVDSAGRLLVLDVHTNAHQRHGLAGDEAHARAHELVSWACRELARKAAPGHRH